ncbi:hypothetical protein SLS60_008364 [Paraconiothyrium brasiliense]|uniref:Uncharacterized protein n=1 Tax=Paraconiothyrium brasiliense TaxID=300254 RepID=A0ABR3R0H2_9PLEO
MSNIRNALNSRLPKEKTTPALRIALDVLNIKDLDGLEHHFLGMTAFLKPWSHFRDAFLLLQPGNKPRSSEPDRVRGMDILWFYTNFSDGELRYDPRADDNTSIFTMDETQYGNFDTTHWGVEEHEKMMYAWLLQEFKVGKARNPFGFEYFELQNVCTAWKTVFVPIVEAVRDSYDPRGRMHYGRLANFIEVRHPSRLAFPEGNVEVPQSANPYRIVSAPRERGVTAKAERLKAVTSLTGSTQAGSVTKKKAVVFEQELRDIYPKYGQVVEKPKANLNEFLANQKARIKRKNRDIQDITESVFGRNRHGRESPMFGCKGIDDPRVIDPVVDANRRSLSMSGRPSLDVPPSPKSPKKRGEKSQGLVPVGMYGFMPTPTKHKNPLHGVTRPINLPDAEFEGETTQDIISHLETEGKNFAESDGPRNTPKPAYTLPHPERKSSDGVYSSIHDSDPFVEGNLGFDSTPTRKTSVEVLSPMSGHPSAVPKPLFNISKRRDPQPEHQEVIPESPTSTDFGHSSKPARMPSYAGTEYDREIKPPFIAKKLHSTLEHNAYDPASRETSFALSEIPEILYPLERQDQFARTGNYITSFENPETMRLLEGEHNDVPQHVPWPGMTPALSPDPLAWPDQSPTATSPAPTEWPRASRFQDAVPPPPIPPKHPARASSIRSSAGSDLLPPPSIPRLLGPRIVSKENIRGHLSNISRDITEDSLRQVQRRDVTPTGAPKLTPFNKNMFPRRDRNGTPVGAWMGNAVGQGTKESEIEMRTLEEQSKK